NQVQFRDLDARRGCPVYFAGRDFHAMITNWGAESAHRSEPGTSKGQQPEQELLEKARYDL
ncbi:MAG: hypothetical protein WA374_00470, partial [Acidobacteriaceae bacterium]